MKIVFIKPILETGGGTLWMLNTVGYLVKRGHEVIVLYSFVSSRQVVRNVLENVGIEKRILVKTPCIKIPTIGTPLTLFNTELKRMLASSDIIYIHFAPPIDIALTLTKQFNFEKIRSPLILGIHQNPFISKLKMKLYRELMMPISIRTFSYYHVLNKYTFNALIDSFGINKRKIFLIPNGVDTRIFQLCRNPLDSNSFNILFTGRLTKEKGADTLIKVIWYVNEKFKLKDLKFTIAGSGPLEKQVGVIARMYENVDYLGFVDPEAMPRIYMNANLFLITSRMEGMPLSLLEAQSCGLPAIGSKIPGISDIIIGKKTGCLVDVEDVKSFAEAIKKYYELWRDSPEEYYSMNKAIREHIVRNYEWSVIIDRLERMFKKCASIQAINQRCNLMDDQSQLLKTKRF